VHAFVDESKRPGRYLMCAVLVAPAHLTEVRRSLAGLCLPRQRRLHLNKERDPRRRLILDRIAALPVRAVIFSRPGPATQARRACLRAMTAELIARRVIRLVIEPADGYGPPDRRAILDELRAHGQPTTLVYEHVPVHLEPILWAADAVAWGYGAGGDWRRRIQRLIETEPEKRETRAATVR